MKRVFWMALIWLLLTGTLTIAAPSLINYQGTLTDDSGVAVNGSTDMSFALFDAATGGTELWFEDQNIDVQNGSYNVLLGSVNPLPASLFSSSDIWLEVRVGAVGTQDVLAPRQQLVSVPYALSAARLEPGVVPCFPGDFINCYTGATGTMNVGICASGTRTCDQSGVFGGCADEVTPVVETCNSLDDDCNGIVDDNAADASTWYADTDSDGHGDVATTQSACTQPSGYVADSTDCLDSDATVYPGAYEVCDGLDNDCNTLVDDNCGQPRACNDQEVIIVGDCSATYPDPLQFLSCISSQVSQTCSDAIINLGLCGSANGCGDPVADEACYIGNCPDEYQAYIGGPAECTFGATRICGSDVGECQTGIESCVYGGVWEGICSGSVGPVEEICGNGLDDDCDGSIDEPADFQWCRDADGDGSLDPTTCTSSCDAPGPDYTQDFDPGNYDCNDADPAVNPWAAEICGDGIDNDCNAGTPDIFDPDGDGFDCSVDCDEGDPDVNPGMPEICADGIDNDCNGQVDDNCTSCTFDKSGGETASITAPDAIYQAQDASGLKTLNIELFGSYGGPGTYSITNADYSTCEVCLLIYDNGTYFLADSGVLELTDNDPIFAGTVIGANFIEVTIDFQTSVSTPVPGGATRCLDSYLFSVNTAPPVDADGDGVDNTLDCDDADPNNYPGNVEVCDGQDNDCSGTADFPGEMIDADADGSLSCVDCDDGNPDRFPGNPEIVDGVDNDCNGIVDDIVIGIISGDTGRVAGEVLQLLPSTILTSIDFGVNGYTPDQLNDLTSGAQQIINAGSGGSGDLARGLSYEILDWAEGALLLKDTAEIVYDVAGTTADFLVDVSGNKVGVTVARAVKYPLGDIYTLTDAQALLEGKLADILESTANVSAADRWIKQVLFVFAYDQNTIDALTAAYDLIDPALKADTIVYLSRTDGDDTALY